MISSSASLAMVLLSKVEVLPALLLFTCDPLGVLAPVPLPVALVAGLDGLANPAPGGELPLNEFLLKFFTIFPTLPAAVLGPPILGPRNLELSCCWGCPDKLDRFCGETLRGEADPGRDGAFGDVGRELPNGGATTPRMGDRLDVGGGLAGSGGGSAKVGRVGGGVSTGSGKLGIGRGASWSRAGSVKLGRGGKSSSSAGGSLNIGWAGGALTFGTEANGGGGGTFKGGGGGTDTAIGGGGGTAKGTTGGGGGTATDAGGRGTEAVVGVFSSLVSICPGSIVSGMESGSSVNPMG